jgi:hypothetical protein
MYGKSNAHNRQVRIFLDMRIWHSTEQLMVRLFCFVFIDWCRGFPTNFMSGTEFDLGRRLFPSRSVLSLR